MRKTFQRWLFFFVALAFACAMVIIYFVQTNTATVDADELIGQRIDDAETSIDDYVQRSALTRTAVDSTVLDKASAAAFVVAEDPSMLTDDARLASLADTLGVDELVVTDGAGVVVGSCPASYRGFDMTSTEQSEAFLGAISYPGFRLVQDFRENGAGTAQVKYGGVARVDAPGIVQVGYYRQRMEEILDIISPTQMLEGIAVGQTGRIYLIEDGRVISSTSSSDVGRTADELGLDDDLLLGRSEARTVDVDGTRCRMVTAMYDGYTIVGTLPTTEMYANRNGSLLGMTVFNFALFLLVFILVSYLIQRVVIDGIFQVNRSLSEITAGNLDESVEVRDNPEFDALSDGINQTVGALKEHIAKEAGRIDADLALAKAIQLGNLQTTFPAFPDRDEFDLYAHMIPAREVGGDFYDMFMPDDGHLVLVVADVSGKGIPAAMFMMEAKSYINTLAQSERSLPEVFMFANEKLCENNGMDLFVTAFILSIDLFTGAFVYVDAGHNPPAVVRADGSTSFLPVKHGFVLGGMEGTRYREQGGSLEVGDALVLYTDGVTEALDTAGTFYGEERLAAFLGTCGREDARTIVDGLGRDLARFRGAADQADDITVMAMRYRGGGDVPHAAVEALHAQLRARATTLTVDADDSQLQLVLSFLDTQLETKGFSSRARKQVAISAEEIFVNIAHYAYRDISTEDDHGTAVVSFRFDDATDMAVIEFLDAGMPYDPLSREDPDITMPAEDREVGGLGVFMVKKMMDDVEYAHEDGRNHLTLRKRRGGPVA